MKQNSPKKNGADRVEAADVDVFAALATDRADADTNPSGPGAARRVSSMTATAILAVAATVLGIAVAGSAVSAAAASIPESEAMAAAQVDTTAPDAEALSASVLAGADAVTGPVEAGRWEYSFSPVQWAQRDAVLAANVTPPPQPEGYGWALVNLTVRNIGVEPATPGRFEVVLHTGGWTVSHLDVGTQPIRMPGEYKAQQLAPDAQSSGTLGFWLPDYAGDAADCLIELRVSSSADASYTSYWLTCD